MFTGKLDWDSVSAAKTYYVLAEYMGDTDASEFVFINNGQARFGYQNKKIYELDDAYCQFAHTGNYSVKVVAVPDVSIAAVMQDDKSYIQTIRLNGNLQYADDLDQVVYKCFLIHLIPLCFF